MALANREWGCVKERVKLLLVGWMDLLLSEKIAVRLNMQYPVELEWSNSIQTSIKGSHVFWTGFKDAHRKHSTWSFKPDMPPYGVVRITRIQKNYKNYTFVYFFVITVSIFFLSEITLQLICLLSRNYYLIIIYLFLNY